MNTNPNGKSQLKAVLGFSSMGAPAQTLAELSDLAEAFDMGFLELRALEGTTALPHYFTADKFEAARQTGIVPIRVISSDLRLLEAGEHEIEIFVRFAALADLLEAPYVRVFGGGKWGEPVNENTLSCVAATVLRCREELQRRGVRAQMLIETHFSFSSSLDCARLNEQLPTPLPILWDSHHTWRRHGESPAQTWSRIGPWVQHIHYKDSRLIAASAEDGDFVLPGCGEYPGEELLDLLIRVEYTGGVSLEWEKLWHPDLPELSAALPGFRAIFNGPA